MGVSQAFNAGPRDETESGDVLDVHLKKQDVIKEELLSHNDDEVVDKYPAPSTPQLKHGVRLVDNGDCHDQDQTNIPTTEKGCTAGHDGDSKFVETTLDGDNSCKSLEDSIGKNSIPDLVNKGNEASEQRPTKSSRRKIKVS